MMRESDLVKAFITSYNRREWLRVAVESVLEQTHQNLHVVIVDDASTDGSGELARAFEAEHPDRVTAIVKPKNRGYADTIQVGLDAVQDAPFVAFLNEDDFWYPTKIERQLQLFQSDPDLRLACCESDVVNLEGERTGAVFSDDFGRFRTGDFEDTFRSNHVSHSTLVMRQDVVARAAATLPETSISDYYIVLLATAYAPLKMIDEPLAAYRPSPGGMHHAAIRMERETTYVREQVFERNPDLVERYGGARAVRRKLALQTIYMCTHAVQQRQWREVLWHARVIARQRQLRPLVWMLLHTLKALVDSRPVESVESSS